jgi:hypothetical protein
LAIEAVEVGLPGAEAATVLAVLDPSLTDGERLARLGTPEEAPRDATGWLRDLVEDADDRWRSPWLRACAIHAATARDVLVSMATAPAHELHDPIVDEELDRAALGASPIAPG